MDKVNQLEHTHEDHAAEYASKIGWFSHKYEVKGDRANPDRIFMKDNRIFFMEFKKEGEDLKNQQIVRCMSLRLKGFIVITSDNIARSRHAIATVNNFYNTYDSNVKMFFNLYPQYENLKLKE